MARDDFIFTLSDREESPEEEEEEIEHLQELPTRKRKASDMDSDFEFEDDDDLQDIQYSDTWGGEPESTSMKNGVKKAIDIDELVSKRSSVIVPSEEDDNPWDGIEESEDELIADDAFGMNVDAVENDSEADPEISAGSTEDEVDGDSRSVASEIPHPMDATINENSSDDEEEKAKEAAFYAPEEKSKKKNLGGTFLSMHISRPLLRGLAAMQFSEPTPIQAKTIPVALLGKDIVGSAVTGSGKTAAFMVPILERLLYRSKKIPTSRVAILMPTRELAVQCFQVGTKIASFTDITFCQLVGGFSLRAQEQELKKRPDIIIATPGRFIDHMRNSASFTIDTLEILVLDEADRMLEDGFADELNEILTTIPRSRQTMLFSATMTSNVDRLISIGLNRPVRIMVDAKKQTVTTLTQEFLRLRRGREVNRLAYLLHLCKEVFTDRCIIFFGQKKEVHRVRIVFALFGFKAAELHGNMTQEQRIASLEKFRAGHVSHLLATDVAARGLDIKGVDSVINYEAPQSHETYLHRVGRTARAGRSGRACTFTLDTDRKVIKQAVKTGRRQGAKIVTRTVNSEEVDIWIKKLDGIDEKVKDILGEEKEQQELLSAELQVKKAENIIDHESEIMSRPKRTWFQSEKDKKAAKQKDLPVQPKKTKVYKRKISNKEKKKIDAKKHRLMYGMGPPKAKRSGGK